METYWTQDRLREMSAAGVKHLMIETADAARVVEALACVGWYGPLKEDARVDSRGEAPVIRRWSAISGSMWIDGRLMQITVTTPTSEQPLPAVAVAS